jgi:tripartite-type tricarboxylate transporter receptor subunit TctC
VESNRYIDAFHFGLFPTMIAFAINSALHEMSFPIRQEPMIRQHTRHLEGTNRRGHGAQGFLRLLACMTALECAGMSPTVQAQTYPAKPLRVLVPFPPGGTPDIQIRMMSEHLLPRLGQAVLVDNRPGASGAIAMELAARAQPDGYTLVIGTVGNWTVNPHLFKLPFDVQRDFTPVIQTATTPAVLVVNPSLPVRSVRELVALAQKQPGALNYGGSGVGGFGHMCTELFSAMTRARFTHVPYKGVGFAMTDLISGQIQLMFNSLAPTMPHIKTQRVRALATTGASRADAMRELPTVAEAGVPGYENTTWSMIAGPAKLPSAITTRLNGEMNAVLQLADVRERLAAMGSTVTGGTAAQAAARIRADLAKYGKLIAEAGIKATVGAP